MTELFGAPFATFLGEGGPVALISFLVVLMFLGKIRPEKAIQEVRADRDARLEELRSLTTHWREAYLISESARMELASSIDQLVELARTNEALLRALREEADDERL